MLFALMNRLLFRLDGFVAKEITVPSKKLHILLFLSVFAHKRHLAPFSIHTPQKPSFKPINESLIVAGIYIKYS